jgi:general secretion pathway protein J
VRLGIRFIPRRVVRVRDSGFTLVEMLVALTIFALLAGAGVALLRTSIDSQTATAVRLDDAGAVMRLRALLSSELATAQPRPYRGANGDVWAAMSGSADRISFVHAGGDNGTLERVSYAATGGAIRRSASDAIDGGTEGDNGQAMLDGIAAARWQYRSIDGVWRDNWTPTDIGALPRAVALTVERNGQSPLLVRFLVAPDGIVPDAESDG